MTALTDVSSLRKMCNHHNLVTVKRLLVLAVIRTITAGLAGAQGESVSMCQ